MAWRDQLRAMIAPPGPPAPRTPPRYLPPAATFQPPPLQLGTPPAAAGSCQVVSPTPGAHRKWLVDRYSVQLTPATVGVKALVWYDAAATGELIDGTDSGSRDVSANNPPVELRAGRRLVFQWTNGVPNGAVGSVTILYRDAPE